MRSRPYVTLKVPSFVYPGGDVKIEIIVESTSKTPINFIEIDLLGNESARDQEQAFSESRAIVSETARVCDEMVLEEETYRFEGTLRLPYDAPFSYTGYLSEITYFVRVRVDIPWWPDATERSDLVVAPQPEPRPERVPAALAADPPLEIAIDDRAFAPGDEITGAIALSDVQGRRIGGISLSLVGMERLRLRLDRAYESHRTTTFLKASPEDEGREIPFRFRIPRNVTPAFDCGIIALGWAFEARFTGQEEVVRAIPIRIGAFTSPPAAGATRSPIGSGRWREVWGEAAERARLSLAIGELRMRGSMKGLSTSIGIEHDSEGRPSLAARLEWPSWELGLRLAPMSLRALVFVGADDVFGRYRVEGRDQAQARAAITAPLRTALLAFDSAELDDERALLKVQNPGKELSALDEFLKLVRSFAAAAREAAAHVPPPAALAHGVPQWSAIAEDLGGRFVPGSMAVRGASFEGGVFDIETLFPEGTEPARTRIGLVVDPPLPEPMDPNKPADLAAAPPATRALVVEILTGGGATGHAPSETPKTQNETELRIAASGDRIEVDVTAWPAPRPLLIEKMRAMLALRERLGGDRRGGPYR